MVVSAMAIDPSLFRQLSQQSRQLAEERGWTWLGPVDIYADVHNSEPVWMVRTNSMSMGTNVLVTISKSDHAIIHASFLPR